MMSGLSLDIHYRAASSLTAAAVAAGKSLIINLRNTRPSIPAVFSLTISGNQSRPPSFLLSVLFYFSILW